MAEQTDIFEIAADRLTSLYADLKCDGCGAALMPDPDAVWVKAGCGYYCPDCQAKGLHLTCRLR